jgi:hypothetical protein
MGVFEYWRELRHELRTRSQDAENFAPQGRRARLEALLVEGAQTIDKKRKTTDRSTERLGRLRSCIVGLRLSQTPICSKQSFVKQIGEPPVDTGDKR